MKRSLILSILLFFLFCSVITAQEDRIPDSIYSKIYRQMDLGLGIGLNYGGILGVSALFCPISNVGVFGSVGIQFGGIGWQVGMKGFLLPKTRTNVIRPYAIGMYGINAATYVDGISEYTANFKGATVGAGLEVRFGRNRSHGLNTDINYPFRSQEYFNLLETIKYDIRIEDYVEPAPVIISIGYHWEF